MSFFGLPSCASDKKLPVNAGVTGDAGSIPGSRRSPGGRHGNPLQYSYLGNPMDRGACQAIVHRVTKSWTQLKQLSMHAHRHTVKLIVSLNSYFVLTCTT